MRSEIAIIGGGVIGLGCAWRLAQAGAQVHLFERGELGHEASWAAAGMLAAQCEAAHYPPHEGSRGAARCAPTTTSIPTPSSTLSDSMFDLCQKSRALYPNLAAELLDETGLDIELSLQNAPTQDWRQPGILYVAAPDDIAAAHFEKAENVEELSPQNAAALLDAPKNFMPENRYFWLPQEGQVENRLLTQALTLAARRAGAQLHERVEIKSLTIENDRIAKLTTDDGTISSEAVLLCAGAWSAALPGLPKGCAPPVRPVAGQMLALRPQHNVRSVLYGTNVYLVPRRDGRLLVGATVEENDFETATTPGAARHLQNAAAELWPSLRVEKIEAHWAGLRPGTPDGLPILGKTSLDNLWIAAGHYRNGILLTPITTQIMANCLLHAREAPAAFRLERFF